MVPLEDVLTKPEPEPRPPTRRRKPATPSVGRPPARPRHPERSGEKGSTPLPPGHVRKKATGEIGRVKALDAEAGTATVSWLRGGKDLDGPDQLAFSLVS